MARYAVAGSALTPYDVDMAISPIFDGVPNSRGLGGLPLRGGGQTPDGVLYRSSSLQSITPEGLQQFAASPIGMVADLRTPGERAAAANRLPTDRLVETIDASINVGNMTPPDLDKSHASAHHALSEMAKKMEGGALKTVEHLIPSLGFLYEQMLHEAASQFAIVASLVAQVEPGRDNAVLIHCTAGKDRTGIATALILDTAGVEREAVIEDYAVSQDYLAEGWSKEMLKKMQQAGVPLEPRLVAVVTTTPPEAIEEALRWVDKHHGSSADYLRHGGLTTKQVDAVIGALN